jgi:hypothetical protein
MAQITPIRTNDGTDAVCLSWAQLAGLIAIRPDGSWHLTEEGRAGTFELVRQGYPFSGPTSRRDRWDATAVVHLADRSSAA